MPLVERALQVLERREVTPQLGLLKSTMLQLDATFSEKAFGAGSFTEFVEKLKDAGYVNVSGGEGRYVIERKTESQKPEAQEPAHKPEEALPLLRDILEMRRIEMDAGAAAEDLEGWVRTEHPDFDPRLYGFQEFTELLNFAQDKLLVRVEPEEERGLVVISRAEFYPPAPPGRLRRSRPASSTRSSRNRTRRPRLMEPPPKPKRVRRTSGGTKRTKKSAESRGDTDADAAAPRSAQATHPLRETSQLVPCPRGGRSAPRMLQEIVHDRTHYSRRAYLQPRGPYSPAVRAGDFLFVSGPGPVDPETDKLSFGDIRHETRLVLGNIRRILEGCGASMADVVKCSVYLAHADEFAGMNEVYAEFFGDNKPARTTVESRTSSFRPCASKSTPSPTNPSSARAARSVMK